MYYLLLLIIICAQLAYSQCDTISCTAPSSYTTLNIDNLNQVDISAGSVVGIQNMNGSGTITNRGTLYLPNGQLDRDIINYGTLIVGGNFVLKKSLRNESTGKICFLSGGQINNGALLLNHGIIKIAGNLHFNSNASLYNTGNGCLTVTGNITIDKGSSHCNSGQIVVNGNVNVSNGGSFSACEGFAPGGGVINQNSTGIYNVSSECVNCIGPLGVTLLAFKVENNAQGNTISWKTADEREIDLYSLYYSNDGYNWELIHNESGREHSSNDYSFFHYLNSEGEHYYQLAWKSNGIVEKSNIIVTKNSNKKILQVVNLLGQVVDEYYKGTVIVQYEDGSTMKFIR